MRRRECLASALATAALAGCGRRGRTNAPTRPQSSPAETVTPVDKRFGLFVPTRGEGVAEGDEVRHAAQLALEDAQKQSPQLSAAFTARGGKQPWGAGADEAVRLFFEDNVVAVLGGLRGQSAHLAEQLCVKAQVPFITPWAQDMALSQTNLPWFFRTVPNDRQQAETFAAALEGKSVTVLLEDSFDGRAAMREFRRAAGKPAAVRRPDEAPAADLPPTEALVALGRDAGTATALSTLADRLPDAEMFAALCLLHPAGLAALTEVLPRVQVAWPAEKAASREPLQAFSTRYRTTTGRAPSPLAVFAYEAAAMLLAALTVGADSDALPAERLHSSHVDGLLGPVSFSEAGDREFEALRPHPLHEFGLAAPTGA